jgi:DNA-binding NarL/FixJ family response regulator
MLDPYKIAIVDDHAILRAGVKNLIELDDQYHVVGEAGCGIELFNLLERQSCDLAIVDLSLPDMSGLEIIERLRESQPDIKILVLTMHKDSMHFKHSLSKGVWGYILKEDAYEQLLSAIKSISGGKKFISPSISNIFMDNYVKSMDEAQASNLEILTTREKEVLKLIAQGLTNKDIAGNLHISVRTVEFHRLNLSKKLGIRTSAGLVKFALSNNII